jgi:RES domain-containing protein
VKLAACARLSRHPETRKWYRALDPKHSRSPLSSSHTTAAPSRFSPGPLAVKPFEILYFSETHMVALLEVEALLGSPHQGTLIANPAQSWLTLSVDVQLQQVADLTSVAEQKILGTTVQELTGDWEGYQLRSAKTSVKIPVGTAPTQDLGEALFGIVDLEGFRVVSAKLPYQENLVVFPQKLLIGSRIAYRDSHTGKTHVLKA